MPITVITSGSSSNPATTDGTANTSGANLLVLHTTSVYYAETVSDSYGNTWTHLTPRADGFGASYYSQLHYCVPPPAKTGPGHTFAVTGGVSAIAFLAASGADPTPLESEAGASPAGTLTSAQPGSLTPGENGALCVAGLAYNEPSHGAAAGSPYTTVNRDPVSGISWGTTLAYLEQAVAGAVNPTFTWTGAIGVGLTAAVFKPATATVTPVAGVGSAAGLATAAGVGVALVPGVGTAAGVATAAAVGVAYTPPAGITVVAHGSASNPATVTIDTSGANLLVAHLTYVGYATDVSDSHGNTWTPLTGHPDGGGAIYSRFFYCTPTPDKVGPGHAFTGPGGAAAIAVLAVSGADTTPLESETGASFTTGTSAAPGSLTPAEAGALCVAGLAYNEPGAGASADGGYTTENKSPVSGVAWGTALAWLVPPAVATVNPTFTWAGAAYSAATAAVFRPAGVVATPVSGVGTATGVATAAGVGAAAGVAPPVPQGPQSPLVLLLRRRLLFVPLPPGVGVGTAAGVATAQAVGVATLAGIRTVASRFTSLPGGGGATTTPADTGGANLIVVHTQWNPGFGTGVFSDSYGNVWNALTEQSSADAVPIRLHYCVPPPEKVGPDHTFSIVGNYASIGFVAVSGASPTPFDGESGAVAPTPVTSIQPGGLNLHVEGSLVVTAVCPPFDRNATVDGLYETLQVDGDLSPAGLLAWIVRDTAFVTNPTFSWTTAASIATATAAAFLPASAPIEPPEQAISSDSPIGRAFDAFHQKLIADGIFTESQCLISQTDEENFVPKPGTVFAILFIDDFSLDKALYDGGGRATTVETGRFYIILMIRNFIDKLEEDHAVVIGNDPAVSILSLAQQVTDSLQGYFPDDPQGVSLVVEPFRFSYQTRPRRLRRGREWTTCRLYFDVSVFNPLECV